jgi:membrane protease YdiL (CAAX protease family)
MEVPPRTDESAPVNRTRWWIHLIIVTAYIVLVGVVGLMRHETEHPALTHTAGGLLAVCGFEILLFGVVLGLAWLASRASADDLLLRWRGTVIPVLLGAGYSIALRVAVGVVSAMIVALLILTHVMSLDAMKNFAENNRPGVEKMVDIGALQGNPAYLWLTLTLVSFVVAGLREELWRVSFLAALKKLWPRQFGSTFGQICAVAIAAVIFGLAHFTMGILAVFLAGLLGLGLGLIMIFHRSIWPAVIAHGFFDATSMALIPWAMHLMQNLPKS